MQQLGKQSLALVASPLLQDADFTQPDQHIPCSFIINEPQCVFRQLFESTLRQRRITLENTIELWSIESIKQCVAANLGISFLPRFAVERELSTGQLKSCRLARRRYRSWRCAPIMPGKRSARQCRYLCSVWRRVLPWKIKKCRVNEPGIIITLRWIAPAFSYRLACGAYRYFCIAVTFLHARLLFFFLFFFSARFASTFSTVCRSTFR